MTRILLFNTQRDLPLSKRHLKRAISFLLGELKISTDELSFHFVSERAITRLHADLFDDPTPTDCITLPIDSPQTTTHPHILGEAFICPKTALLYAKKHRLNPIEELYRYVIHCLLHLIGETDETPLARGRMKRKEKIYLARLDQHSLLKLR